MHQVIPLFDSLPGIHTTASFGTLSLKFSHKCNQLLLCSNYAHIQYCQRCKTHQTSCRNSPKPNSSHCFDSYYWYTLQDLRHM